MKKRGPVKRKKQITVRLDSRLMAQVYAQMAEDGARITDVIEDALLLVLRVTPRWTHPIPIRHLLRDLTAEEVEAFRGLAIRMVEDQIKPRTPDEEAIWKLCEWLLLRANSHPRAAEILDRYLLRSGKPSEEIEVKA